MAGQQNSIYAPTPFPVDQGGTGRNINLSDGQLWVGRSGNTPNITTLTAGTGISVTNGSGSITIATTGSSTFTWNTVTVNTTLSPFNGYFIPSGFSPVFSFPTSPAYGDTYTIQAYGGLFTAVATAPAAIFLPGNVLSGTTVTATDQWGAITFVCSSAAVGFVRFVAPSTNGASFLLT